MLRKMLLSGEALLSGSPDLTALSDPRHPLQAGVCLVPALYSWWLQWVEQLPPPTMVTASQVAGSPQGSGAGALWHLLTAPCLRPRPADRDGDRSRPGPGLRWRRCLRIQEVEPIP